MKFVPSTEKEKQRRLAVVTKARAKWPSRHHIALTEMDGVWKIHTRPGTWEWDRTVSPPFAREVGSVIYWTGSSLEEAEAAVR